MSPFLSELHSILRCECPSPIPHKRFNQRAVADFTLYYTVRATLNLPRRVTYSLINIGHLFPHVRARVHRFRPLEERWGGGSYPRWFLGNSKDRKLLRMDLFNEKVEKFACIWLIRFPDRWGKAKMNLRAGIESIRLIPLFPFVIKPRFQWCQAPGRPLSGEDGRMRGLLPGECYEHHKLAVERICPGHVAAR